MWDNLNHQEKFIRWALELNQKLKKENKLLKSHHLVQKILLIKVKNFPN